MELKIDNALIDEATNNAFSKLISDDNYNNPIKKLLEQEFNWNMEGEGKSELAKQFKKRVEETVSKLIDSPEFHTLLGEKIAIKFAELSVKDLRTLKDLKRN